MAEDFISRYLAYTKDTEPPAIYHRWSILTSLSAYMGRQWYVNQGHFNIHPNLYVILIGGAGTRKNTAITLAKRLIKAAGYTTFAASKTSKEKLFIDLAESLEPGGEDVLEQNLFGEEDHQTTVNEVFIASGEFNTFFGNNILSFLEDLGELWDWEGPFENKIKNGKSVIIHNPTINILGGTTPTMFAKTFPPEFIGQGFFSRCFLIYGEKTRPKITFPPEPDAQVTQELVDEIKHMRAMIQTRLVYTSTAKKLIDRIYHAPELLDDVRFESFYNRRLSNLLKLCSIVSVARHAETVNEQDVVYANTILSHAEQLMPKALGEFGRAKNSDVTHKILQLLHAQEGVVSIKEIWKHVSSDLEKPSDIQPIIEGLMMSDKILKAPGGFLPRRRVLDEGISGLVDYSLLTAEERNMHK